MKVILFVVNSPSFFLSHRLPLAIAAQNTGYDVHVCTSDGAEVDQIRAYGFIHSVLPFRRGEQNPFKELGILLRLVLLFWRVKPSVVHLVTIKPVIYGSIAARFFRATSVVSAVSGLGTVFLADTIIARARRWFVVRLYRVAFNQMRLVVIFQNSDDRNVFLDSKILRNNQTRMIRGSGVALQDYPQLSEPQGVGIVVMAARLLKDKGVVEFVEAAKLLRQRKVQVIMRLIGSPDLGNPSSITQKQLDKWGLEDAVELLGYRETIAEQYALANIVCLPSYREGLPKSLIEAAACSRAVVTTDVPGCRDAIIPDETGLLVPAKDPVALADAIQILLEAPLLRSSMGKKGRTLAEESFAIEKIVEQHMMIYRELTLD
jgi:glycosyltransferase involved in cell wall biosynthesis